MKFQDLLIFVGFLLIPCCSEKLTIRSFVWDHLNHTVSKKWTKMTSDSSGQYLAVIDHVSDTSSVFTSGDYGHNWTKAGISQAHFSSISSDASGKLLSATISGGGVAVSSDHGVTWKTQAKAPSNYWTSIASDASGKHLAAVVHLGGVFVSADGGETWTQTPAPSSEVGWVAVTIDDSGANIVAVASTGDIFNSQDYGKTWTKSSTNRPRNKSPFWSAVASDVSGKYVAAVSTAKGDSTSVMENGLFYSEDFGKSFVLRYHMAKLSSVSMDGSGQVLASIVTDSCNNMYVAQSFDGGASFDTSTAGAGAWNHVMVNRRGDRIVATQSSGVLSVGRAEWDGSVSDAANASANTGMKKMKMRTAVPPGGDRPVKGAKGGPLRRSRRRQ